MQGVDLEGDIEVRQESGCAYVSYVQPNKTTTQGGHKRMIVTFGKSRNRTGASRRTPRPSSWRRRSTAIGSCLAVSTYTLGAGRTVGNFFIETYLIRIYKELQNNTVKQRVAFHHVGRA